jgi:indole-3-glycerol phosphate synthase
MDILDKIRAYKLDEIAAAKRARPLAAVEARRRAPPGRCAAFTGRSWRRRPRATA